MITYIFLLVCGVDLLFKIHRAFLLRTRERAVVLLAKPPGTESVKGRKQVKVTNYNRGGVRMQMLSDCLLFGIYVAIGAPYHSAIKKCRGNLPMVSPRGL